MKTKESEFVKIKKGIAKEEVLLGKEFKKEEKGALWFFKSHTFRIAIAIIIFIILIASIIFLATQQGKIYIENSEILAPVITLSSANPGILEKVFVKEGDQIADTMIVAQVSGNPVRAEADGLAIQVMNAPGELVNSQTPIVEMIEPQEMRVIGHIEENKGLSDIKIGQRVVFTVDAFGSKTYGGIVDSISQSPTLQDIVFSISDKRQERQFDVKVKFDVDAYPELRQGMSAKMWIYK